jgi:GGDEF domain-containing protein
MPQKKYVGSARLVREQGEMSIVVNSAIEAELLHGVSARLGRYSAVGKIAKRLRSQKRSEATVMEISEPDQTSLVADSLTTTRSGEDSQPRPDTTNPPKQPRVGTLQAPSHGAIGSGQEFFRSHLSREMRRADRYNVPVSLVHFRFNREFQNGVAGRTRQFLEVLKENKRETDVLASLNGHLVSVLLASTDRSGAERFAERVSSKVANLKFSSAVRTYPNDPLDPFPFDQALDEFEHAPMGT